MINVSDILQYTGLLSSFVLLCGVLKFYLYYKRFGISILRFIDLSEIVVLFMDNLLAYLAIIIPTTITVYLIFTGVSQELFNKNVEVWNLFLKEYRIFLYIILICVLGVIFFFILNPGVTKKDLALLILLVTICLIVIPFLFIQTLHSFYYNFGIKIKFEPIYLLFMCTILLLFSIATAYNEAFKVLKNNYYKGVKIILEDNTILLSNSQIFFIGMTKNYFFFYNVRKKSCTAHKIDKIKSVQFNAN